MFRFENPEYLWLLVAVAVLALIRFVTYFNQKKRLRKFGDPKLMKQLMPDVSRWRPSATGQRYQSGEALGYRDGDSTGYQ